MNEHGEHVDNHCEHELIVIRVYYARIDELHEQPYPVYVIVLVFLIYIHLNMINS